MNRNRLIAFAIVFMISLVGIGYTADVIKAGRVTLTRSAQLGDTVLHRGTYRVELVQKEEGMFIRLTRKNVSVEDLAITLPSKWKSRRARASVQKVWNQPFFKVTVHYGDTFYVLYLEFAK